MLSLPHDWGVELPFVYDKELPSPYGLEAQGYKPLGRRYPETSVGWYRRVFDVPRTDLGRHIFVDFVYIKCPKKVQQVVNVATRIICIAVYLLIGWNLLLMGIELHVSGELTITRHVPFYPIAYALGLCCFAECLVLICDIGKIAGGTYE